MSGTGSAEGGTSLNRVTTIFFDLWNTLGYTTHSPLEIWLTIMKEQGIAPQQDVMLEAMSAADLVYNPRVYEFRGRMPEFWDLYDALVLKKLGLDGTNRGLLEAVNFTFLDNKRWLRVFPGTHYVLSTLKQRGYGLGIISNNTDGILDEMRSLDLVKYFDTITYSQEAGAEKPDPAPFRLALHRAGRNPDECLHVGDSYEQDIVGARNAGIEPVLIDREGKRPETDCVTIRDLKDVLQMSKRF